MVSRVLKRCCALVATFFFTFGPLATSPGFAQSWPDRPIKVIVPYPPGYAADPTVRKLASELTKVLGQSINVETRTGASGRIAVAEGARATPDVYTFFITDPTTMFFLPMTGAKVQYDSEKDLVPVARLSMGFPLVVVSSDSKVKSLQDFKTLSRPPTMALVSLGGYMQATVVTLAQAIGQEFSLIPYASSSPTKDVIGGSVDAMLMFGPEAIGLAQAGKIRVLATFDSKRTSKFPDVPSVGEHSTLKVGYPAWSAITAPAGTPIGIVEKMRAAVNQVLAGESFRTWIEDTLSNAEPLNGLELRTFLDEQRSRISAVVKSANLRSE
jgi:tripartite-type tricarboxylate transporter receptor subunit TctC